MSDKLLAVLNQIEENVKTAKAILNQTIEFGLLPNFNDPDWPAAVPTSTIVESEHAKQLRAKQIVSLIGPTADLNMLDYGCGEGHVVKELSTNIIGFDIKPSPSWSSSSPNFTTDKKLVKQRGPYDIILLYDVLDHLEGEDPIPFMKWIGGIVKPNGRIFVRTHPWTSRHGGHLYENKLNKAYAHLALTNDELLKAGFTLQPNLKVVRPLATYEHIFKSAKLSIIERKCHAESVESFFSDSLLDMIIKINWEDKVDRATAIKIMSLQFIDYKLCIGKV